MFDYREEIAVLLERFCNMVNDLSYALLIVLIIMAIGVFLAWLSGLFMERRRKHKS